MRLLGKILFGLVLTILFLLPLFSWIAAEPAPYSDPEEFFTIDIPNGWKADDSGHMGKGVIMKGPAGPAGMEPIIHLLHEPAGVVTLDVQWPTHLGRLRYELEKVKFLKLEDFEKDVPPFSQAHYSYAEGGKAFQALTRMFLSGERFFLITAAAPEGEFDGLQPLFQRTFDSLSPGGER